MYMCMYICIHHLSIYVLIYVYVSTCSSSFLSCWTVVTCNILYAQWYLITGVISKLQMCSFRFNFTRTFLKSFVTCFLGLTHHLHPLMNCLRGLWNDYMHVFRVCFDCVSHLVYTEGMYLNCLRVVLISQRKYVLPPTFNPVLGHCVWFLHTIHRTSWCGSSNIIYLQCVYHGFYYDSVA